VLDPSANGQAIANVVTGHGALRNVALVKAGAAAAQTIKGQVKAIPGLAKQAIHDPLGAAKSVAVGEIGGIKTYARNLAGGHYATAVGQGTVIGAETFLGTKGLGTALRTVAKGAVDGGRAASATGGAAGAARGAGVLARSGAAGRVAAGAARGGVNASAQGARDLLGRAGSSVRTIAAAPGRAIARLRTAAEARLAPRTTVYAHTDPTLVGSAGRTAEVGTPRQELDAYLARINAEAPPKPTYDPSANADLSKYRVHKAASYLRRQVAEQGAQASPELVRTAANMTAAEDPLRAGVQLTRAQRDHIEAGLKAAKDLRAIARANAPAPDPNAPPISRNAKLAAAEAGQPPLSAADATRVLDDEANHAEFSAINAGLRNYADALQRDGVPDHESLLRAQQVYARLRRGDATTRAERQLLVDLARRPPGAPSGVTPTSAAAPPGG
jgi:hypothetical protein